MNKTLALLICMLFVITGCSTMTVTEKDQKRSELDAMAETAIAGLIEQDANLKAELLLWKKDPYSYGACGHT